MTPPDHGTPEGTLLWEPSARQVEEAHVSSFRRWLQKGGGPDLGDYPALWEWSVTAIEDFWAALWAYFEVPAHRSYDRVLEERVMPGARWFPGAEVNFAAQVFRHGTGDGGTEPAAASSGPGGEDPALIAEDEEGARREVTWRELAEGTARLAAWMRRQGVARGDRVAAYVTNGPEAVMGMLASASVGAIWSSCSPDFGVESVLERFGQIEPKVLLAVDGYAYGGKRFDRMERVARLQAELPGLERTLLVPVLDARPDTSRLPDPGSTLLWPELLEGATGDALSTAGAPGATRPPGPAPETEPVPFDHPLWILYSSGTTGLPKPIVHSHGGMLLEHLKYMAFHADVGPGDRFFWFTTTGWMMWNVVLAALLRGATALLYEGSPGHPDAGALWRFAERNRVTHFGASAPYLVHCMGEGLEPGRHRDLGALRMVGSTGAPLPPEAFRWVYESVRDDVVVNSTSGGTDICSSFVGGCPVLPVHAGEIQCRTLGASVHAYDEAGRPRVGEVGEMVVTEPMPCMPVFFWGDEDGSRYRESYFETFPGVWRHGDWIKVTPRGSCVIYGRSDATLNRMGVRIGTSEIYRAVAREPRVLDSLVVSLQEEDGSWYMPLFVVVEEGDRVDEALERSVKEAVRERVSPRFVPDELVRVAEIPYTLSGKKLEKPVKRILEGVPAAEAASLDALRNPGAVRAFEEVAATRRGAEGDDGEEGRSG